MDFTFFSGILVTASLPYTLKLAGYNISCPLGNGITPGQKREKQRRNGSAWKNKNPGAGIDCIRRNVQYHCWCSLHIP